PSMRWAAPPAQARACLARAWCAPALVRSGPCRISCMTSALDRNAQASWNQVPEHFERNVEHMDGDGSSNNSGSEHAPQRETLTLPLQALLGGFDARDH